jgi:dihydropyrimidinase
MAITWWGEQVFNEMKATWSNHGINTFKHFMAYKGALMVNDDEMFASFQRCAELGALPLVHAENGDVVAAMQQKLMDEGNDGPEAHAYSRPPSVEGEATNRAIMIADMAGCAALCRPYLLRAERTRRSVGPGRRACASMASR